MARIKCVAKREYEANPTHGSMLIMIVLGIVWSADIGAYFRVRILVKIN